MNPERVKKTRSLGTEAKTPRQTVPSRQPSKRAQIGARHNSAPLAAQCLQNDAALLGDRPKTSGRTTPDHQARTRTDDLMEPLPHVLSSPTSERHRKDHQNVAFASKPSDQENLPLITFAVVGTADVGKSTFIHKALNSQNPSVTSISSAKIRVGGSLYRLRLIETPRDSICLQDGKVLWPYTSESDILPDLNGVLYLYDVSDRESLEGLPNLLKALYAASVKTCLVACKVDIPQDDHNVPATFSYKVKQRFPSILLGECSRDSPESAQQCLLKIVQSSLGVSAGHPPKKPKSDSHATSHFPTRHSSITTSHLASSSLSQNQSHSRHLPLDSRSRDSQSTHPTQTILESEDEKESVGSSTNEVESPIKTAPETLLRLVTRDLWPGIPPDPPYTPLSMTEPFAAQMNFAPKSGETVEPNTPDSLGDRLNAHEGSYWTFLDMDDESIKDSPVDAIGNQFGRTHLGEDSAAEGVTFTDLVNRLLAAPTSKGDSKFIPSFLCLYRVFATPKRLLMAIIDAFVRTEKSNLVPLTKTAELLRCLGVLGLWTMYYPGDFANATVWETAMTFVTTVEKTKAYAAAAKQIVNNLQTSTPDDDSDWAFSDASATGRDRAKTKSQKNLVGSVPTKDSRHIRRQQLRYNDDDGSDSDDDIATPSSPRHSATTSSASSIMKGLHVSSQTSDLLHNLEVARARAKQLRMAPHHQLSKMQWHQFMSYPTDDLAIEITRIDWTIYSAIRPREFVRYAMVSSSQRAQAGQVDYIGIMTKHFNHLALFVAGMILLRDKPKHRAKMLEKFMDLAWKVRHLNNYHALGAIVAALNGEEIVRLSQTQELISNERHKQFLRLKILMGHQKSHAAYRMAWENSSAERIPFLPRIQEDLIKAATVNRTFVKGQIKWSKFEVMGETLVGIQKSQEQPYVFPDKTARSQDIEKLILETKILESGENSADPQQELYERSKQVEPTPGGGERKKFEWLRH